MSFLAVMFVACVGATNLRLVPANSALLQWSGGRILPNPTSGAVAIDLENTKVSISLANATFLGLQVLDASFGGALLGVSVTNAVIPGLRIATLVTSPHQSLYTIATGSQLQVSPSIIDVTLLSEFEMIADRSAGNLLQIEGFVTDGVVLASAPLPTRRVLFLGDSLSSGVGAGHSVPPSNAPCGAGVLLDDSTASWPAVTCARLNATCTTIAASGWTLFANTPNIPGVLNLTLPSMVFWPETDRVYWDFGAHPKPDAIVIELGENDCHAGNCSDPGFLTKLSAAFVSFVTALAEPKFFDSKDLPVFLTIAPHEAGQSAAMLDAVRELRAAGYNTTFLNATVSSAGLPVGCGGHPSAEVAAASANVATSFLATALGWQ